MHLEDAFIQSDLQLHSGYTFFNQYVCSLGIKPTTFSATDTMLYHWATQEHIRKVHKKVFFFIKKDNYRP